MLIRTHKGGAIQFRHQPLCAVSQETRRRARHLKSCKAAAFALRCVHIQSRCIGSSRHAVRCEQRFLLSERKKEQNIFYIQTIPRLVRWSMHVFVSVYSAVCGVRARGSSGTITVASWCISLVCGYAVRRLTFVEEAGPWLAAPGRRSEFAREKVFANVFPNSAPINRVFNGRQVVDDDVEPATSIHCVFGRILNDSPRGSSFLFRFRTARSSHPGLTP